MKTSGKSMNTMEKPSKTKTMEKSMNKANCTFYVPKFIKLQGFAQKCSKQRRKVPQTEKQQKQNKSKPTKKSEAKPTISNKKEENEKNQGKQTYEKQKKLQQILSKNQKHQQELEKNKELKRSTRKTITCGSWRGVLSKSFVLICLNFSVCFLQCYHVLSRFSNLH